MKNQNKPGKTGINPENQEKPASYMWHELLYLNAEMLGIDASQHAESIGEGPNFGGNRQIPNSNSTSVTFDFFRTSLI